MANSSLSQLLSAAPARNASARERSPVDAGAQSDTFSRTLDQKMKAPERPAERPVDRSAERAAAQRPATPEPTRNAHAPAKPAATAEARQNTTPARPKDAKADASTETASGAQSTTDTTTATTASTPPAATAADAPATDAEATLITASGDPANTAPAAALAATPAALAAATASPTVAAEATPNADADTGDQPTQTRPARGDMSQLSGNAGQAKTPGNTAEPSTGLNAAQPDDAPTTAPAQARPGRFAELLAANTAPRGDRVGALSAESPNVPGTTGNASLNAAMSGVQVPAADRPHATQAALPIHVGTPASEATWGDAVGNRVLWLVGQNNSKAELILTPPHLGKLEISLTVTGDTTTAQFTAATPAAREALEQAMPRLREMLEQAGVTLTDSNVNTTARDSNGEAGHGQGRAGNARGTEATQENLMSRSGPWLQRGEGMIDTFA
ncbi:flagellar hook-length control protein FliK [Zoogloeaceae bacterium G21618-S1]|nr:flagellar hook-length control protein FliK [Zoogloeaceae bacterium G21618-S1]